MLNRIECIYINIGFTCTITLLKTMRHSFIVGIFLNCQQCTSMYLLTKPVTYKFHYYIIEGEAPQTERSYEAVLQRVEASMYLSKIVRYCQTPSGYERLSLH